MAERLTEGGTAIHRFMLPLFGAVVCVCVCVDSSGGDGDARCTGVGCGRVHITIVQVGFFTNKLVLQPLGVCLCVCVCWEGGRVG